MASDEVLGDFIAFVHRLKVEEEIIRPGLPDRGLRRQEFIEFLERWDEETRKACDRFKIPRDSATWRAWWTFRTEASALLEKLDQDEREAKFARDAP